jgi:protein-tyrosine-phosphatase/DNA-binding transcriptional ArsR family regulator
MIIPSLEAPLPRFLKLLAHDVRWQLLSALAQSDWRVQELVARLHRPANLVSYHLRRLRQARLVREGRSTADRRDVYYSLDLRRVQALYAQAGRALHPALVETASAAEPTVEVRFEHAVRVLFLCTHNSARSQMAEAILRHLSRGQIDVRSAGNQASDIHPLARRAMRERGISMEGQRAKHLSEFEGEHFDYIVTVCDVAREACPVFPGDPEQIHWSFPDPSSVYGVAARQRAFERTATELTTRINYLLLRIDRQGRGD